MWHFLRTCDEYTYLFNYRILNSRLSVCIGTVQLFVCLWSLTQHVYSIFTFKKILYCNFASNSTLPGMLTSVDVIIFDIGLFHALWGIHGCVAQHLDGGYGRFAWCCTHIAALAISLPFAFVRQPRPQFLWPLLIQSTYGIGLLILSLAALPRVLPTLMGECSNAPLHAIMVYLIGTFMNFFLVYIYWHWYWHVEAQWESAQKLRINQQQQNHSPRTGVMISYHKPIFINENIHNNTSLNNEKANGHSKENSYFGGITKTTSMPNCGVKANCETFDRKTTSPTLFKLPLTTAVSNPSSIKKCQITYNQLKQIHELQQAQKNVLKMENNIAQFVDGIYCDEQKNIIRKTNNNCHRNSSKNYPATKDFFSSANLLMNSNGSLHNKVENFNRIISEEYRESLKQSATRSTCNLDKLSYNGENYKNICKSNYQVLLPSEDNTLSKLAPSSRECSLIQVQPRIMQSAYIRKSDSTLSFTNCDQEKFCGSTHYTPRKIVIQPINNMCARHIKTSSEKMVTLPKQFPTLPNQYPTFQKINSSASLLGTTKFTNNHVKCLSAKIRRESWRKNRTGAVRQTSMAIEN